MRLFRYILPFVNLISLKDIWKNNKIGTKLIIEPTRIVLQSKNNSVISVSKELINKDNSVIIKWIDMKDSYLRVIDDNTIVLFDNNNTELYKRNQNINHIFILYLIQTFHIGITAYSYFLLASFIDFVFRNSGRI